MATIIGQFFKNIFTTWAGMLVSMSIAFFFTPYLIDMLGKERYGIWSLAFSITAYLSLADLGIKQSIVKYISEYLAKKDWKQLNEVYSSALRIYFYISMLILIVAFVITFFFVEYFKIPPEFVRIAQVIIMTLGINEAVTYAFIPIYSLGAFHRFDITSYFRIGRMVIQTAGMIALLEMGYGLIHMGAWVLAVNLLFIFSLNFVRRHLYPENRFAMKLITPEKTRMLLNYGIYSFLIAGAWMVIFHSDNIIVGSFIDMEAVAVYSVAVMIITQIRGAIQIVAVPLVPAISHFQALDDYEKIMSIYHKSTKYMYYVSAFIAIMILFYGGPFIMLWVEEGFSTTIDILHILIVTAAIYLPQTIANSILFGISKHKITFYVLLGEAVAKILLSIILLRYYGLIGVAIGTAIPQLVIYTFVYPYVFHRTMKADLAPFYRNAGISILRAVLITVPPAYLLRRFLVPDSWPYFFSDCALASIIMLIGLLYIVLETEDRDRILDKLRSKFGKRR